MISKRTILHAAVRAATLLLVSTCTAAEPDAAELNRRFKKTVGPFLNTYCLDCHGHDQPEAKLDLTSYSSARAITNDHQIWAIVLERLEAREMPPTDSERQPDSRQRQTVIDWIKAAREFEATRNAGDPGPVLARRLSNAEYNYSIRDLTGVDIRPTATFPVDPANEAGFDNSGESLAMSPALLNKYLGAARQIVEHLVLTPDGIAFAPHPVVTDTDRDKYCVKRIVQFYQRQPTDYADYFHAAWKFRHHEELGQAAASLHDVAVATGVSPRYLSTVWSILADTEQSVGPVAKLRSMWHELPPPLDQPDTARADCEEMRDWVVGLRGKLVRDFDHLYIDGHHKGSQPFVLWRNRQYASHRRNFDQSALQVQGVSNEAPTTDEPTTDEATTDEATTDEATTDEPTTDEATTDEATTDEPTTDEAGPVDEDLLVPDDDAERNRYEAAFQQFCSVFPDAFYISERGRGYVEESKKQDGEKGRLLSAGFHSMLGYFRDDGPLYDLILDESAQREIDRLWQQLDFIAAAPMRQYVGFLWFERTDSRFMRDPEFDFARAEDKNAQSESMIEKLADVYLKKAMESGGSEVEVQAIEDYFQQINDQIRWVESARVEAEHGHLKAVIDFAARAYRRRLSVAERNELANFYTSLRNHDGLSHEEAIQDTVVSVLMSPYFCYRLDLGGAGAGRRSLTDDELASRLSYFLWSSMPDEKLLGKAVDRNLHRPEVMIVQTHRMLQHKRVRGFVTEFVGNWLDFRRFEQHNAVDRERFPEFTDELRQAMFEEPIRFFVDLVQHDRSVLECLYGDHTFVNPVLAKHYGMEAESLTFHDEDWLQVTNAADYGRGGLLPMSVFLTKNAPGLRTSPVKRGYWVVRRLLGERIPPPPPNVPELPDDETKLGDLTLRETLARHRDHESCAGCHDRFDSIGLTFEGFGPIGEFRDKDLGGRPVSTTATFPSGDQGTGLDDLRTYLRQHRQEEFLDNLCRKLLSYALGRSLILSDDLLVRRMRTQLESDGFRFSSLVRSIVSSSQFLNKRNDSGHDSGTINEE